MPEQTIEERAKNKEDRSGKAKNLLKEKGDSMNKAEKAFVGHFVKKDAGQKKPDFVEEK